MSMEQLRAAIVEPVSQSLDRIAKSILVGSSWAISAERNYDDWWRCELRFEPGLDEVFGITHTKQQIHPTHNLIQVLTPDLQATAKILNRRVRQTHERLQGVARVAESQKKAAQRERDLPPLPKRVPAETERDFRAITRKHPELLTKSPGTDSVHYSMVVMSRDRSRSQPPELAHCDHQHQNLKAIGTCNCAQ